LNLSSLAHKATSCYFYVNQQNQALINDIKQGLEAANNDGSFDRLFVWHYGEVINKARQTPRKTYELNNPHLPPNTPLDRKELWIDLGKLDN